MILSAGLSPAWQQILRFDQFRTGNVNRAAEAHWCASGKVINVAVAAKSLGEEISLVSAIGGLTGDAIQRDLRQRGLPTEWIDTGKPTRVCTTIIDDAGQVTELVEEAASVSEEVLADFVDRARFYSSIAAVSVFTGSLPKGTPADLFAQIMPHSAGRLILDLRGESLRHCLAHRPFLVKPNRDELESTVGKPMQDDRDLLTAMNQLNDAGAEWVLITNGPEEVWLTSLKSRYRFTPPRVEVINPIGSGDCLAAALAVGLSREQDVVEAVRFGVAAATHNCQQLLPGRLDIGRCRELFNQVVVE